RIIEHYQLKENNDAKKDERPANVLRLADLIAVVTPFVGQKFTLRSLLRKAGMDISGLTIGTVHALQGAERPIVLFSSTYGTNDIGKGYFFDSGVNMLNVAVSRAKDCFIVFGFKDVFDRPGNSPSAMLYRYIQGLQSY